MIGEIIGIIGICLFCAAVPAIGMYLLMEQPTKKTEWISTKERLPENISPVLFYTSVSSFEIGYYDGVEWLCGDVWYERDEVTHWIPLPKPPKDGRKDGAGNEC